LKQKSRGMSVTYPGLQLFLINADDVPSAFYA
jgi:hypothetical protein